MKPEMTIEVKLNIKYYTGKQILDALFEAEIDPRLATDVMNALARMPSAEPEPKTGKWIKTYRNGFGNLIGHCNKCGRSASVDNYCPNCGAKMEVEYEED